LKLSREQAAYLRKGRVARLATIDETNSAHLVPVVYACIGNRIYFVIDRKLKRPGKTLKRIRNISENEKATLLIDNYSEDWDELSYLMIYCRARIIGSGENYREKLAVTRKLKEKYLQYGKGDYFPDDIEKAVFVKLEPQKAIFWRNLRHSVA
jgi:PPOX class probable F420-dependent enzyme